MTDAHSNYAKSYLLWGIYVVKVETMTGDVHNKSCDIHILEYSTSTKIKILKIFNDMEKYYIVLSQKEGFKTVYFHCCDTYLL